MAFPEVRGVAHYNSGEWTTSHTVPLPSDIQADELLLAFITTGGAGSTDPSASGWTQIGTVPNNGANLRGAVLARKATGSEGSTVSVSTVDGRAAFTTYRIGAWHGNLTEVRFANFIPTDSAGVLDPPNLSVDWGTEDTLWFALSFDWNDGAFTYTLAAPTNYGNVERDGGVLLAVHSARRELAATSDNPAKFTVASGTYHNDRWFNITGTVAVRPGTSGGSTGLAFTTAPTVTSRTTTSYTIGGTLSESGDVFAVAILPSATDPTTPAQIIAGTDGTGAAARGTGQQLGVTNFSFNITGTNLSDNPTHDIFVVGRKQS
jgi:hypothetical protein